MTKHIHGGNIYQHQNCMDFSANCNPLGTPESVKEAVKGWLNRLECYPQVGCGPLCQAIAEYEGVKASQVLCGNGAADLIFTLCRTVKPAHALLPCPTFAEYGQALESVDCCLDYYELTQEHGFSLGRDFLDCLTPELDMVFLCNPNNPTGVLTERDFLMEVLDKCSENNIFLVVDECFLDFVKEPEQYTLKEDLEKYPCLFLLKAFTKRYAMAGLRLGYGLCGNRELLDKMEACTQPWNVSSLAQAAGLAALQEKEYVEAGRKLVFEEADFLKREMAAVGLKVFDSRANYLFFKGPADLYEKCLEKGILIRDCSNYPGLCRGYYRIAVKKHEDNCRFLAAVKDIKERGR